MAENIEEVIYPENIDQVSVINESLKTPLARVCLSEDSSDSIFNNPKTSYGNPKHRVSYMVTNIIKSEHDSDSVLLTITDMDFPDREFQIEILIQYANAAFILSQMVKTPMFFLVPSDDVALALGYGPYQKNEIHTIIEAPQRKTPEFNKISKLLFNLSKPSEDEKRTVVISAPQIDEARIELVDVLIGLIDGEPESLIKAYSYLTLLNNVQEVKGKEKTELTDADKHGIILRDFILKLEQETHPIYLSTLFRQGQESVQYVNDIEQFETIMNEAGMDSTFGEVLNSATVITSDSSQEDMVAYFSAPIDVEHIPLPLKKIIMEVDINYLWTFNWNTALEEEVDFDKVKAGDFFTAMLLVVAIRLARVNEVYRLTGKSVYSPLAIIISSLTSPGEDFMWIVKESVKLLAHEKQHPLFELLTIPNDVEGRSPYSGPLGIILHGLAHEALESGLTMDSLEIALKNSPSVVAFLSIVMETYASLPPQIKEAGESACFIKGLVLPNMGDVPLTREEAKELIDAVIVMGEMSVIKHTEYSVNSPSWKEYLETFYNEII